MRYESEIRISPARRVARAAAVSFGVQVGLVGRWALALIVGGIWYGGLRGAVPQDVRAVGFAAIVLAIVWVLKRGRDIATTCPWCRARHGVDAHTCPGCGRDVPSRLDRV